MGRYTPTVYDITIYQRATFQEVFILKDADTGDPIDLTGAVVRAEVWDKARQQKYATFTASVVGAEGKITLKLAKEQTALLPPKLRAYWDMIIIWPDGSADYLLEGKAYVDVGYTHYSS